MARLKPLKAVIFDLDGTLIDNEGIYDRAFCAVLKKRDISCSEVSHTPGIGVTENWQRMIKSGVINEDPQVLTKETYDFYLEHLKEIIVRPGVREVMYFLKNRRIKRILATSTGADVASRVVGTVGIAHHFDSLTFGDEVPRRKPAPDLFLKALEKENIFPEEALVVEDAPAGVEAAKAAGAPVVALKTDWATREELFRADAVVNNFADLLSLLKQGKA
ncbi:MAG: HAD family phosphatase [Patescibacteria group bacterium]